MGGIGSGAHRGNPAGEASCRHLRGTGARCYASCSRCPTASPTRSSRTCCYAWHCPPRRSTPRPLIRRVLRPGGTLVCTSDYGIAHGDDIHEHGTFAVTAGTALVIMRLSRPMRTERDRACPNTIAHPRRAGARLTYQDGRGNPIAGRDGATDPAVPPDLPAWCHMTGHQYLDPVPDDERPVHTLRIAAGARPTRASAPGKRTTAKSKQAHQPQRVAGLERLVEEAVLTQTVSHAQLETRDAWTQILLA